MTGTIGLFLAVAILVLAAQFFAVFSKKTLWRATITPLASITGSGFLVSAPLLAREVGGWAAFSNTIASTLLALIWVLDLSGGIECHSQKRTLCNIA